MWKKKNCLVKFCNYWVVLIRFCSLLAQIFPRVGSCALLVTITRAGSKWEANLVAFMAKASGRTWGVTEFYFFNNWQPCFILFQSCVDSMSINVTRQGTVSRDHNYAICDTLPELEVSSLQVWIILLQTTDW